MFTIINYTTKRTFGVNIGLNFAYMLPVQAAPVSVFKTFIMKYLSTERQMALARLFIQPERQLDLQIHRIKAVARELKRNIKNPNQDKQKHQKQHGRDQFGHLKLEKR